MSTDIGLTQDPDRADVIAEQLARLGQSPTILNGDTPGTLYEPEPPEDPWAGQQAQGEPDPSTRYERMVAEEVLRRRAKSEAARIVARDQAEPLGPFDAGTLAEILARPPSPPARVRDLIPWEASTLLVAQRKTGKTTLTLNLTRALLTGEDFLGRLSVQPIQGAIAMLNYEVSAAQVARWAADLEIDPERLFLVNLRGRRNPLGHAEDRQQLAGLLRARDAESLIVDPFGRAYTGVSQNDAGEVGTYLTALDQFVRGEVGARDLILTAHAGWNGERTRGSTALEDWADSIITLTRDGEDDGSGERFIRAVGRDIDFDEDRLDFDPELRLLTLAGAGSRKQAKAMQRHDQLDQAVLGIVTDTPGINGSEVEQRLRADGVTFQRGEHRKSLSRLETAGMVTHTVGQRGAKQYSLAPDSPGRPDLAHGSPADLAQTALIRRARSAGQLTEADSPTCSTCHQSMTVVEPGQTTHPSCEALA